MVTDFYYNFEVLNIADILFVIICARNFMEGSPSSNGIKLDGDWN